MAIHFDNGWLDTYTISLPILQMFSMTAMCFPITHGVEAASEDESGPVRKLIEGRFKYPFMTWDQVGELLHAGWEIGAHTAIHPKLGQTQVTDGDDGVLREVETSHATFQKRLGFEPEHFAYPGGSRNEETDALLSPLYRSLRLWHFEQPIQWTFTHAGTPRTAIDCQNIDMRVPFEDFKRIFREAQQAEVVRVRR